MRRTGGHLSSPFLLLRSWWLCTVAGTGVPYAFTYQCLSERHDNAVSTTENFPKQINQYMHLIENNRNMKGRIEQKYLKYKCL